MTKKGLTQLPDYLEKSKYAPHDLASGWAEPFIGNLIFYYLGFQTGLKTINEYPIHANAPKEVFEENINFEQLCSFLVHHFKTFGSPVMIDDSHFSMVIYGIQFDDDGGGIIYALNTIVILSIGDPHIFSNKLPNLSSVGCYDVLLDSTGKQLSNIISPETIDQYIYPGSYLGIQFDGKAWMMTYLQI